MKPELEEKSTQCDSPLDRLVKCVADGVANDILLSGSDTNGKATRVALRVGNKTGDIEQEKSNGGLCEYALANVISDSLKKHLST